MVSIKALDEATKKLSDFLSISYEEAQRKISEFKNDEMRIKNIINGDFSDFAPPNRVKARDIKTGKTIQAETVGEAGENLPDDMLERIENLIEEYRARDNIEDMTKITYLQWRAVCIYVGMSIKKSKLLEDIERERREGGKYFDPNKILKILDIYEYVCGRYSHAPNVGDFISFSGVSSAWFYDNENKDLTSSRVDIRKKVLEVEARGQRARLTDGRGNPTSSIFYLKAKDGWREEATETRHNIEISVKNPLPNFILPESGGNTGLLPPG